MDGIGAVVARHYTGRAVEAPVQGAANRTWLLGDGFVLRVARDGFGADLRKEAVVAPAARAAGVRTPEIVECGELPGGAPYMVVRRVHGTVPRLPERASGDPAGAVFRELGGELARVHALRGVEAPVDEGGDPRADVAKLRAEGWLGAGNAEWLDGWFARLERWRPASGPERVLLHGDVSPQNLLVDPAAGALAGLLDWGDAAWADPAAEFAKLPLRAATYAVDGYLAARFPDGGVELRREWAARVLTHHLHWSLGGPPRGPVTGASWWSAEPLARLLEILRFFVDAESLPEGWRLG